MLRKFALLAFASTLVLLTNVLLANFALAQQVDIAVSGSTLLAAASTNDSATFHPPVLKNGTYLGVNGDFVGFRKRRLGLNFETAWRYHKTSYPFNGESYRPIFTDANVLFQPMVGKLRGKQVGLDLMVGVGVATTTFTLPPGNSCNVAGGGCVNFNTSNHFMEDLGFGVRYNFWRHFFVRPEIRYYHVQNYTEFNSSNVFRGGVSVGYTFPSK